jgi:hypothetical protein
MCGSVDRRDSGVNDDRAVPFSAARAVRRAATERCAVAGKLAVKVEAVDSPHEEREE